MIVNSRMLKRKKEMTNPFRRCMKCKGKVVGMFVAKDVYLFRCPKCGRNYARSQDIAPIKEKFPNIREPIGINVK